MPNIIPDTNVWVAYLDQDDALHHEATKVFANFNDQDHVLVTEYVLLETTTVLANNAGKEHADMFLEIISHNKDIDVLPSTPLDLKRFINEYQHLSVRSLSFVDVSLIVLSKDMQVITFDKKLEKKLSV